jgi:hypothetical protein
MTMGVGEKCVATLHPDKCWFIAEEEEVEEVEEKELDDGEDEDTGGNSSVTSDQFVRICSYRITTILTIPHTLYTIHHTPYTILTIHHTPYTIRHTPYAIRHTPYTIHHTPYTIHRPPYYCHNYSYNSLTLTPLTPLSLQAPISVCASKQSGAGSDVAHMW